MLVNTSISVSESTLVSVSDIREHLFVVQVYNLYASLLLHVQLSPLDSSHIGGQPSSNVLHSIKSSLAPLRHERIAHTCIGLVGSFPVVRVGACKLWAKVIWYVFV